MLLVAVVVASLTSLLGPVGVTGAGLARQERNRVSPGPARAPSRSRATAAGTVVVTMPPVGLSLEYPTLAQYLGSGPCPPPALVGELQRLGSPPIALSGHSQDLTEPAEAVPATPPSWEQGSLYALQPTFWGQLHCLLAATGEALTAGINAETGQLAWAQQIAAGARTAAVHGLDFSIANEPDLYLLPNYASLSKRQLIENLAAIDLYLRIVTYLRQATGSAPLVAPELAIAARWRHELPGVIAALHPATVGVHLYPLSVCDAPRSVTLPHLLSTGVAEAPRSLQWVVADASAAGLPAIISESNSASCGGGPGVSDQPASAVWAVRFVLSALKTGFREVRFHASGGAYDPFFVVGGGIVRRPLESGLAALNRWLPVGAALRTVAAPSGLLETAVNRGGIRAILDNETGKQVTISLARTRPLTVEALTAVRAGLQALTLSPRHGLVKLTVPRDAVLGLRP
jgi:hypothetical protein